MATRPANAPQRPSQRSPQRRGTLTIRLLPVTIFVAALMLTVRVTDLYKGLKAGTLPELTISESEAQQPPPPVAKPRVQRANPNGGLVAAPIPTLVPAVGGPPPEPPPAVGANADNEPPTFTPNEIDVLQKLAQRREALDKREHDLALRENLLKAAEARIDKKIVEIKSLQTNIASMLKQVDQQDDVKMKSLVKIYENMKPKDAAKIFEQLDLPVLMNVVQRMKEQKVAPIMEAMDPFKAKTITDAMANRRTSKAEGVGG